jgi:hypothetical protein
MKQDLPSSRLSGWVLQLQAATPFKILHRPGSSNLNADALSQALPLKQIICSTVIVEEPWYQKLQS